jgi:hypothetical protein
MQEIFAKIKRGEVVLKGKPPRSPFMKKEYQ